MKILIVETSKVSQNSTIAHVRNSIILQEFLEDHCDCRLTDLSEKQDLSEQWDIILFSYATGRADFSNIEKLLNNQTDCKVGWITNEFELFANGFVKEHMTFMINNFHESGIKKAHKYNQLLTTNLNTLIAKPRNQSVEKKYDVIYYGTYRKYRDDYFRKYLKENLIFSTSKKNWKTFIDVEASCKVTDKISWVDDRETLNLFKASLYIEDTKTHDCFNFMANRFFESLYCNTAMFFDKSCMNTIEKDLYHIDPYFIVSSYDELINKVNDLDHELVENHLAYNTFIALSERDKTLNQILNFLKGISNE